MSLISCPECNHEISDSAVTCPHCGFSLPPAQEVVKQVRTSEIEYTKKKPAVGVVIIVTGIIGCIGSLPLLPIGILGILGGIFFIGIGYALYRGQAKFNCPYCGKENLAKKTAVSVKCPFCKKTSVKEFEKMKTVD